MSQGAVSFGYLEDRQQRMREREQLESALEVLARTVSHAEFLQMQAEVKRGLRELGIENGFLVTCFTPAAQ